MMLSDENSIFLNVVNTSSPLFFDDADLTIQRTAKSAEAACVGNNLNITPVLDVCTTSWLPHNACTTININRKGLK
jgi:hypothetical protein